MVFLNFINNVKNGNFLRKASVPMSNYFMVCKFFLNKAILF